MAERLFGTDGVRGRAGEGWLSEERASALGRAIGVVLGSRTASEPAHDRLALLGHDGRRSGPGLEAAVARGLGAAGYRCSSAGLVTTPGLAFLGRQGSCDLCVMISASHNPASDNGIKVFLGSGDKLPDDLEDAIEAEVHSHPEAVVEGAAPVLDPELEHAYLLHLTSTFADLRLDGLSVVIDCANGGGSRVAPRVLGRLGAVVVAIAAEPDGDNINHCCGATRPEALQAEVVRGGAALGIALDGDGDRCILVDSEGELVNGDGILTLTALFAAERGELRDPRIVATVMSNRGLQRALRPSGIGVVTTSVGDRAVAEALRREGLAIGGEQSGHVIFGAENQYTGDGMYTALRVLRAMRETGKSLAELASPYRAFPQVLINVPVRSKPDLGGMLALVDAVRRIEEELGEDGRVLLRYSGTEDLARVMVEGPDAGWIRSRGEELARMISAEIGVAERGPATGQGSG